MNQYYNVSFRSAAYNIIQMQGVINIYILKFSCWTDSLYIILLQEYSLIICEAFFLPLNYNLFEIQYLNMLVRADIHLMQKKMSSILFNSYSLYTRDNN